MSLLISFRGPRRREILLPSKGGRRKIDAGSMSPVAPGELRIPRQARWIVTLELLETSLRLSWSPLGAPETSGASKSDARRKVSFDFELSTAHFELWKLDIELPEQPSEHLSRLITKQRVHFIYEAYSASE